MAKRRRGPETATILSATHDGRGIAALEGKKVFVAGALEGEEVRFQRRKRRRNYDEAELLEVLKPSPDRITPRCDVFGICGGCSLQHIPEVAQRSIKQQTLADNLERIGSVVPERWLPPLYDEAPDGSWHYRRRARLAVKDVSAKGRVLVGFREQHAPYVTNMTRCEVLAHPVDALLEPLSAMVGSLTIRARLPQIEVAVGDDLTALLFRVLDEPSADDLAIMRQFATQHGIEVLLQPAGPDSVRPLDEQTSMPELSYRLAAFDISIVFDVTDFVQVNRTVNEKMVSAAIDLLGPEPGHSVLDLFCGIGNFTLPLARRARYALGIEGAARQVERARGNASQNGIDNAEFISADLSALEGDESWLRQSWDRLLLDPARSGADGVIEHMEQLHPARIVYVSCHPGTLARDAGMLVSRHGYRLEAAGIIDMFPHTAHVESIAVFNK